MDLKDKTVAILGAGGSGLAAAALALQHGALVTAFDSADAAKLAPAKEKFAALGVSLVAGSEAEHPEGSFDYAVISPGIDAEWPIAAAFARISGELLGEIEFAYRFSRSRLIGITGTNGKTTTTELVTAMLQAAGKTAVAAGNIGLPFCEVVGREEAPEWVVLELSSFQLETVSRFRVEVAVWINFAPDHMDRYRSIEDYRNAKLRIFDHFDERSVAVVKAGDLDEVPGRVTTFSAFDDGADFVYDAGAIQHRASGRHFPFDQASLHGRHNAENMMVALAVADALSIPWSSVDTVLKSFTAPPHRCEKVGVVDGVTYINDSKATNLHALESALAGQERPVILIVGGKEKGLDFAEVTETVARSAREVICLGEIAQKIHGLWSQRISCHLAASLDDAVNIARSLAQPGDDVLFSPGTSSFDMFTSYAARGDAFRDAVRRLG